MNKGTELKAIESEKKAKKAQALIRRGYSTRVAAQEVGLTHPYLKQLLKRYSLRKQLKGAINEHFNRKQS